MPKFLNGLYNQLQQDFSRWHDFRIQPRMASHYKKGVIELMPTTTASHHAFKFVNGHPTNTQRGLPNIVAFGALTETETGIPTLLTDMTLLTAFRTAVTSTLAANYLARDKSQSMALIGTGAQSEFQALAFHHLLGITTIQYFDTDSSAMSKFHNNLDSTPTLKLKACASIEEACDGCDIITTATAAKQHTSILSHDMMRPGLFINGIGGDCPGKTELENILDNVNTITVDYLQQAKIEGEIQHCQQHTHIKELHQIVTGEEPGRQHDSEIHLFDSVGCAIEDFSALTYINQLAKEYGIGQEADFIPQLSDPKNLFGLL